MIRSSRLSYDSEGLNILSSVDASRDLPEVGMEGDADSGNGWSSGRLLSAAKVLEEAEPYGEEDRGVSLVLLSGMFASVGLAGPVGEASLLCSRSSSSEASLGDMDV